MEFLQLIQYVQVADVTSSLLLLDLSLLPVCKEELSPEQQERSSSLLQEEPPPPHIKEEQEELLLEPEEADGVGAPSGKNGSTTNVKTLNKDSELTNVFHSIQVVTVYLFHQRAPV